MNRMIHGSNVTGASPQTPALATLDSITVLNPIINCNLYIFTQSFMVRVPKANPPTSPWYFFYVLLPTYAYNIAFRRMFIVSH